MAARLKAVCCCCKWLLLCPPAPLFEVLTLLELGPGLDVESPAALFDKAEAEVDDGVEPKPLEIVDELVELEAPVEAMPVKEFMLVLPSLRLATAAPNDRS